VDVGESLALGRERSDMEGKGAESSVEDLAWCEELDHACFYDNTEKSVILENW